MKLNKPLATIVFLLLVGLPSLVLAQETKIQYQTTYTEWEPDVHICNAIQGQAQGYTCWIKNRTIAIELPPKPVSVNSQLQVPGGVKYYPVEITHPDGSKTYGVELEFPGEQNPANHDAIDAALTNYMYNAIERLRYYEQAKKEFDALIYGYINSPPEQTQERILELQNAEIEFDPLTK